MQIKKDNGKVNAVFYKSGSLFALYRGKNNGDFLHYQCSPGYHARAHDFKCVSALQNWLADFHLDDDPRSFMSMRDMKEGERASLVSKVLHICEVAEKKWMVFIWDGTDSPPINIDSNLEYGWENPPPLQLEPLPLPRDVLRAFPTVGSVLRVMIDHGNEKVVPLIITGKWVKFLDILCEVREGLWYGVLTPSTRLRYVSNESQITLARKKAYKIRLSSKLGRIPYICFPRPSPVTEVDDKDVSFVTLMDVLTHSEVTAKFNCIVRVVAAFPWQVQTYFSDDGTYGIRLTIEDPTGRIHAYLYGEDGEKFFDGHPSMDVLIKKRNKLLGVAVDDDGKEIMGALRNPPWIQCFIKSYYIDVNNKWGSRNFRIFGTKHVG
ncbi:protection of telomeres protein 1b-like isoform X2 [Mercurialis annua]|uniref:protection of telomeres protein 1b-like isoform X2 n=1 Tax=Mercurialis annua TaxID=3986 RepID=UPI00215F4435|nr:protection of telomeres protein 1b-like isoform X2 [Mercurialis annua]